MGFKYIAIGCGMMGPVLVRDLLNSPETENVTIVDRDLTNATGLADILDDPRLDIIEADASDYDSMEKLMAGYDVAINASSYDFNVGLTKAAIAAKTHFCDMGGNDEVVNEQFKLSEEAERAGVKIAPGTGIAPGAVSIIPALGYEALGRPKRVDYIKIRVGGIPQHPVGPLKYALVFAARGLVNECREPAVILSNGKRVTVRSMSGIETQEFDPPFNTLEAAYTSGGALTLPWTLAKDGNHPMTADSFDYKTLRYPGHWKKFKEFEEQGRMSDKNRADFEAYLERTLPRDKRDAVVIRVLMGHKATELVYDLVTLYNPKTDETAMQQTTAKSASIVAQMMADNRISRDGVLYHECDIPPRIFFDEWAKRGLVLKETLRTLC